MQQVSLFVHGETDYTLLKGSTGPLVYPAFHLYLYSALYYVTDHGTNILRAQCIFALLYLTTLAFVLACYRRVGAPPWLLIPLVFSKRMHSIFLLRLFNDAWATLALWISVWGLQRQIWVLGAIAWDLGLGIKMTMLLAAPALGVILVQGAGSAEAFFLGGFTVITQAAASLPFVYKETGFTYFIQAFDFGRQFLFRWTVNWRFVGEEVFLSRSFSTGLLVVHVSLLLYFLQARWMRPSSSSSILEFVKKFATDMDYATEVKITSRVTPVFVMDTMLASVVIGLLCARSLHYQFYAYLGWASPYLLWRAGGGPDWVAAIWAVQEFCWLTYPSTNVSSALVVLALALQVASILIAPQVESPPTSADTDVKRRSE